MKKQASNIVIVVQSGIVQNVIADQKCNVLVIDHDHDGVDESELTRFTEGSLTYYGSASLFSAQKDTKKTIDLMNQYR